MNKRFFLIQLVQWVMCTFFFGRWFSDCGSFFLGVPHVQTKTNVLFLGPPLLPPLVSPATTITTTNTTSPPLQHHNQQRSTLHQSFIMSDVAPTKDCLADDEQQFGELLAGFAAGLASCVALLEDEDDNVGRTLGSKNVKR